MRVLTRFLMVSSVVAMAACGHKDQDRADFRSTDALLTPAQLGAVASPVELGLADSLQATPAPTPSAREAPARAPSRSSSARHSSSASRSSASPSRASESSGSGQVADRGPVYTTQKHTKRDAAVGAAAGAVIGASVTHSRVKGAVIGGVVGGVLGGVIGNNVDVKKVPVSHF